jgi:hypothetical protein
MSLLERLFNRGNGRRSQQPDIPFGRYTDAYKTDEQQSAWEHSLALFDEGKALDAYRAFLEYLRDTRTGNVSWREENEALLFEFWQGSLRITGVATAEKVKAESRVARATDLNVSFLRRLMEYNFSLRFCRFALSPDNYLTLLFDTYTLDGSPFKLLHALRELALHADKQDDLLLDEFLTLNPAEERTYGEIADAEKEVKYNFMCREIDAALAEIDANEPNPSQYPGSFCYLLLGLAFKLDYLIKPEGYMMDVLERIYGIYFAKNNRSTQQKLQSMRRELERLRNRTKEKFFAEMYRTRNTFGLNPALNHGSIVSLIDGELTHMDWALQHNYMSLALAVPQYIVGLAFFQGAPPQPDREYFHLFYQITEAAYFRELGFRIDYVDADGRLNKRAILAEIKAIAERNRYQFPYFQPDADELDFGSTTLFAKTYLQMVKKLNLNKE